MNEHEARLKWKEDGWKAIHRIRGLMDDFEKIIDVCRKNEYEFDFLTDDCFDAEITLGEALDKLVQSIKIPVKNK